MWPLRFRRWTSDDAVILMTTQSGVSCWKKPSCLFKSGRAGCMAGEPRFHHTGTRVLLLIARYSLVTSYIRPTVQPNGCVNHCFLPHPKPHYLNKAHARDMVTVMASQCVSRRCLCADSNSCPRVSQSVVSDGFSQAALGLRYFFVH